MSRLYRGLLVSLMLLSSFAPVRASETFDDEALACAEVELAKYGPPRNEYDYFNRARLRADCLHKTIVAAQEAVESELGTTIDRDARKVLRARQKALHLASSAAFLAGFGSGALANSDPDSGNSPKYERGAKRFFTTATDLRVLGLASFRDVFAEMTQGMESRAERIMADIQRDLEWLADEEGADSTNAGQKALKLVALADVVRAKMSAAHDELGIPTSSVPPFGVREDRAARRIRKRFKGVGAGYGGLLSTLARVADKIHDKVLTAIVAARQVVPCPFTDPDDPYEGGGSVTFSVDGGPQQQLAGDTGLSLLSARRRIAWIGSDRSVRPHVLFEMYGPQTTKKGTFYVRDRPSSDDAYTRDFVVGSYHVAGAVYWFVSGTITFDAFKTGNKRLISGSFSVIGETDAGARRDLVGRFHLCRFGVERGSGPLDLAD